MVDRLGKCMWGTPCLLSWVLGYSIKNSKKGGAFIYIYIYTHFWKTPWNLYICHFTLIKQALLLEIPQICATPLGNSKTKNPRPMENPHDFFLITPIKSISFLVDSGSSACFFQYPLKFHVLSSPYLVFFWNRVVIEMCFVSIILKGIRGRRIRKNQVFTFYAETIKKKRYFEKQWKGGLKFSYFRSKPF